MVGVAAIHCVQHVRIELVGGDGSHSSGHAIAAVAAAAVVKMRGQGIQCGRIIVDQTVQNGILLALVLYRLSPLIVLIYVTVHVVHVRLYGWHTVDKIHEW